MKWHIYKTFEREDTWEDWVFIRSKKVIIIINKLNETMSCKEDTWDRQVSKIMKN